MKLWDIKTNKLLKTYSKYGGKVSYVRFSPNGKSFFATLGYRQTPLLRDVKTGKVIREFKPKRNYSLKPYVTYSQDVSLIAETRGIMNISNNSYINNDFSLYNSAVFSLDNKQLLTDGDGKVTLLWDIKTGDLINGFVGHKKGISVVQFSSNGKKVFTGSYDHTIKVWDAQIGKLLQTLQGHKQSIRQIYSFKNNSQLLSASNNEIIFWDLITGKLLQRFKIPYSFIKRVVLTPEGVKVLTQKDDKGSVYKVSLKEGSYKAIG